MSEPTTETSCQCQLCGEAASVHLEGEPTLLSCPSCGLLSLAEFPAAEATEQLYQEEYYRSGDAGRFLRPLEWLVRFFRQQRVRSIEARAPARGAILDVGCGRGTLLELCQARGWRALGTQLSKTAIAAARARGVDVLYGELPTLELPSEEFDVVTFFHVLEHLEAPERYLSESRRVLKPGGVLVVEVPDFGGLGFKLLGLRHFCVDYPHHLVFFTESSLRATLERGGFEVTDRQRVSLEYSPFTTLQNLLNVLPGAPNRLYRSLQRNVDSARLRREPLTWVHALVAAPLALPALLLAVLGAPVFGGNTIRLYARKRASEDLSQTR